MLTILFSAALIFQEKPPEQVQTVAVRVPDFYFTVNVTGSSLGTSFNLSPDPAKKRRYLIEETDPEGAVKRKYELPEKPFCELISAILRYGVRDQADLENPLLNYAFRDLVEALIDSGLLSKSDIRHIGGQFLNMNWYESLYWLDEAFPGVFTKVVKDKQDNYGIFWSEGMSAYFRALFGIKHGDGGKKDLEQARRTLQKDARAALGTAGQEALFPQIGLAYVEFIRYGLALSLEDEALLVEAYLAMRSELSRGILTDYPRIGLPFPSRATVCAALPKSITKDTKPNAALVREFRFFGARFPEERAKEFRDFLLSEPNDYLDLAYLLKIAGEKDIPPEAWRKYGDKCFSWHKSKDARQYQKDRGNYSRGTIRSYQKAAASGLAVDRGKIRLIAASHGDPEVAVGELIIAYELLGEEWRSGLNLDNLKKRLDGGNPFDEIDFAAAHGGKSEIRAAARKVTAWALERAARGDSWEFDLEGVASYLESLDLKDVAGSLGFHLWDSGLEILAKRFFQFAGVWDGVNKSFYSLYSESDLEERQKKLIQKLRSGN